MCLRLGLGHGWWFSLGTTFILSSVVTGDQAIEIVAVGSIGAKRDLIKQAFDAAAQANLIGIVLEANWPTHLAVPATTKDHDASSAKPGGNYSQRPQPTDFFFCSLTCHNL